MGCTPVAKPSQPEMTSAQFPTGLRVRSLAENVVRRLASQQSCLTRRCCPVKPGLKGCQALTFPTVTFRELDGISGSVHTLSLRVECRALTGFLGEPPPRHGSPRRSQLPERSNSSTARLSQRQDQCILSAVVDSTNRPGCFRFIWRHRACGGPTHRTIFY